MWLASGRCASVTSPRRIEWAAQPAECCGPGADGELEKQWGGVLEKQGAESLTAKKQAYVPARCEPVIFLRSNGHKLVALCS